ncbi:ribosome biogenesis GTP-binding protein YihA/YsxC [Buchnera aphidicola]|uniref:ribosome biogenesis GTP-binding protein YihA/YsxC n=1 Tax=Buchnera aphidicola TaxID=9 RepID=UPI002238EE59|nr:ribosome biogenesis GTP-binding protein YihA/YsxC [Buchnera aphidicola]MCW5197555.1 ribosome biogenesis GTP-binding protein YihA/YsxC [Buchnera aphidicola (Chaitophorus viminalis)]
MQNLNFNSTIFFKSFLNVSDINIHSGIEVICLGYSNTGKSTLINVLCEKKKLSRVSKSPGRTQLINFFKINENFRIIDFPGYGYSKFNKNSSSIWINKIKEYVKFRNIIVGVVIIVDIKFFFKKIDLEIMSFLNKKNIKIIILLNKCDKINYNLRYKKYILAKKELKKLKICASVQLFSSLKKIGILKLKTILNDLYFKNYL